jgi:predicted AlkP superfamily phosphohydrolase/phosphomutase
MRVGVVAAVIAVALLSACRPGSSRTSALVVIGVDGMDPAFLERHWEALPNLRRMRDTGGFRRLKTTNPPQSPVAWSTFITGLNPDEHGIYDFVHRDPKTLAPYSSLNRTEPPRLQLPLDPWILPLSAPRVVSLRNGTPFWKLLADRDVPVITMRMPTNYPPVEAGHAIAGMGVPDLRGTFGTFTLFTGDPEEISRTVPGGRIVTVAVENDRAVLPLEGPPNTLRKDQSISTIPIVADLDLEANGVRLSIGDSVTLLQKGEWSDWIPAEFPLLSKVASVRGMVRVYAKQIAPYLQLYVTPVNVDPGDPVLPISAPSSFSGDVVKDSGPFYTQGIAEDTAALRHGALSLSEYLSQSRLVFEDERRLLLYGVRNFRNGFLFAYFSVVDQNSHMLWGLDEAALVETYRAVDGAIGEAMRALPEATFLVMSDHGFTQFRRSFQLNAWLAEKSFLALTGAAGGENFANVDWSRTQAYGLGLNGLYLNLRGRETRGVVSQQERTALLDRITAALLKARDPKTGEQIIQMIGRPAQTDTAPDLIIGYSSSYRASWNTGLGGTDGALIEDNNDAWIGDHCVDPAAVPGALLSNRVLRNDTPELRDLAVTILRFYGVDPPTSMKGRDVF